MLEVSYINIVMFTVVGSGSLMEGSDYNLTCDPYAGEINPQIVQIVRVRWFNNSVELPGETSLTLRLISIDGYDSGTYTCESDLYNTFDGFAINGVRRSITIQVMSKWSMHVRCAAWRNMGSQFYVPIRNSDYLSCNHNHYMT